MRTPLLTSIAMLTAVAAVVVLAPVELAAFRAPLTAIPISRAPTTWPR
jgi:hypothetical protein